MIVAVGIADDLLDLSADVKLAGQVLAAVVPVAAGVRVETMTLPFLGHLDLGDWSYPLTVVGIVAVMNIVNFIDGVDGLAAGVCTIAALTFAVIALSLDRNAAGVLAMLTAGAALGYLRHGFHPASIFLGDSGSNLLGYMLAAIAVQGALKTNAVVALVFPLLILAVPILDSSFVIAKRIKYGQPVYLADRWHFHHRFANIGFSQRRTVLYLYGWTIVLAMLALALRFVPYSDDHGNFDLGWSLVIAGFALAAVAASVYLVLVLEILKLKRFRRSSCGASTRCTASRLPTRRRSMPAWRTSSRPASSTSCGRGKSRDTANRARHGRVHLGRRRPHAGHPGARRPEPIRTPSSSPGSCAIASPDCCPRARASRSTSRPCPTRCSTPIPARPRACAPRSSTCAWPVRTERGPARPPRRRARRPPGPSRCPGRSRRGG